MSSPVFGRRYRGDSRLLSNCHGVSLVEETIRIRCSIIEQNHTAPHLPSSQSAWKRLLCLTECTPGLKVKDKVLGKVSTMLKTVIIPYGVTTIGTRAFKGCSGLTSLTIPDGVTTIGNDAFAYCSGLTSLTIPDGVTTIGCYAFKRCSGLTSLTIPDGVTTIGNHAFTRCSGLISLTIPDGVSFISEYPVSPYQME